LFDDVRDGIVPQSLVCRSIAARSAKTKDWRDSLLDMHGLCLGCHQTPEDPFYAALSPAGRSLVGWHNKMHVLRPPDNQVTHARVEYWLGCGVDSMISASRGEQQTEKCVGRWLAPPAHHLHSPRCGAARRGGDSRHGRNEESARVRGFREAEVKVRAILFGLCDCDCDALPA